MEVDRIDDADIGDALTEAMQLTICDWCESLPLAKVARIHRFAAEVAGKIPTKAAAASPRRKAVRR